MKELNYLIIFLGVLIFISCTKENNVPEETNNSPREINYMNLEDYSMYEQDLVANQYLYKYTNKLKNLLERDKSLQNDFVENFKNDNIITFPELDSFLSSKDFNKSPKFTVKNYEYKIVFLNYNPTDNIEDIIISDGISIGDFKEKSDVIEGYNMKTNKYIQLDENKANNINDLLLIANVHLVNKPTKNIAKPVNNSATKSKKVSTRNNDRIYASTIYFKDRYESNSRSEIYVIPFYVDFSYSIATPINNNWNTPSWEFYNMHKDDFGLIHSVDLDFADAGDIPNNNGSDIYAVYFNLYEYDWYAGSKYLGEICNSSTTLSTQRKYYHEWYGYEPDELSTNCDLAGSVLVKYSDDISSSVTKSFDQNKGYIILEGDN